jgi:hypothetical protein
LEGRIFWICALTPTWMSLCVEEAMFAWFVPPIVVPAVLVTLIFALALYQLFGAAWNPSELRC